MESNTRNLPFYCKYLYNYSFILLRYSLVLILLWIGAMKFTQFEAEAIKPLISTSPLMFWLYDIFSVYLVSVIIGIFEILTALFIALRPMSAKLCSIGSTMAIIIFCTTLSFIISLPGWEQSLGGFPALSGSGGFLIKDLPLLAVSVWSLSEAVGNSSITTDQRCT